MKKPKPNPKKDLKRYIKSEKKQQRSVSAMSKGRKKRSDRLGSRSESLRK